MRRCWQHGAVERWRNWIDGASLPVVGMLTGLGYAILQYWNPGTLVARSPAGALIQGAMFGGLMTAFIAWQRRGDREALGGGAVVARADAERVLRTGELPDDHAQDPAIRRLLWRRQEQRRRDGPLVVVLIGGFFVVHLFLALRAGDASWCVAAIAGLALAAWTYRSTRRDLARYDRIEAALLARAGRR